MTLPDDIYSQRILELAASIPRTTRLAGPEATAKAHSKLCGSTVTIDLAMEGDVVTEYGQTVKACLLGQAASSVMGREIVGSTASELREVGEAMRKMLKEEGAPPSGRWADLAVLEPVRDYKARHPSTLLVFDAVEDAIAQIEAKRGEKADGDALRPSMPKAIQPTRRIGGTAPSRLVEALMLAPIAVYRWTISPLLGVNCRHLPSCSDYAREAIETNGAWKGGWLTLCAALPLPPLGQPRLRSRAGFARRASSSRAMALWAVARHQRRQRLGCSHRRNVRDIDPALGVPEIMGCLHVEPESGRAPKGGRELDGGLWGNRLLLPQDEIKLVPRHFQRRRDVCFVSSNGR